MKHRRQGFAVLETVLILVIVALVGFVGWYVWHGNQTKDSKSSTISNSGDSSSKAVTDFASCKAAAGSRLMETYPEQCVTKDGDTFSGNSANMHGYLVIKEWGVKVPLSHADDGVYYKVSEDVDQNANNPTNLIVFSANTDKLAGPAGISCKSEYVAFVMRLPSNSPDWKSDDLTGYFYERHQIGDYTYAIATKKQYVPECFSTHKDGKHGDYSSDEATYEKFQTVVQAFAADFNSIQAVE